MTTPIRQGLRLTRPLLGALAALSLMAALATPAAAGGKIAMIGGDNVTAAGAKIGVQGGSDDLTATALPADQFSLNKATPKLFLARSGEEIPTRHPNGAGGSIVIPQGN